MNDSDNDATEQTFMLELLSSATRYALDQGLHLDRILAYLWLFATLLQARDINRLPDGKTGIDALHEKIISQIQGLKEDER